MNALEDRIRAATRAAAGTVPPCGMPPLRLPSGSPRSPARRWLAPAAAAAAVIVIAVTVVAVGRSLHPRPGGPGVSGPQQGPPISWYVASGQVPPYYVWLTSRGNPNFNPSYAVVRATATGKTLATIKPSDPHGTIVAVTAAADDRAFVLDEQHWATPESGDQSSQARSFYLVRLDSSGRPGPATRLPISFPAGVMVTGVALSPDARKLAIAIQPDNNAKEPDLQEIRLYTLGTAAVRTWSGHGTIGSDADDAKSLSWTADQRTLAFSWVTGNSPDTVRLLEAGTAGGSLLAHSRAATSLTSPEQKAGFPASPVPVRMGTSPVPFATMRGAPLPAVPSSAVPSSAVPLPALPHRVPATAAVQPLSCQQDSIITPDGSAVICGAIQPLNGTMSRTGLSQDAGTSFFEYSTATGKVTRVLGRWTFRSVGALAVDVLWSNPSGSVIIGVIPTAGAGRIGVIRGNQFTPVPGRANPAELYSGAW